MHDLSPFYGCAFCNVGRQTTAPALRRVARESTSRFAENKFRNKTKLNNNNKANKERKKTKHQEGCVHTESRRLRGVYFEPSTASLTAVLSAAVWEGLRGKVYKRTRWTKSVFQPSPTSRNCWLVFQREAVMSAPHVEI